MVNFAHSKNTEKAGNTARRQRKICQNTHEIEVKDDHF